MSCARVERRMRGRASWEESSMLGSGAAMTVVDLSAGQPPIGSLFGRV